MVIGVVLSATAVAALRLPPLPAMHAPSASMSTLPRLGVARVPSPALVAGAGADEVHAPGGSSLTLALVALWYATSVVCNQSSKVLLGSIGAQSLTLTQLVVATVCGGAIIAAQRTLSSEDTFPPLGIGSQQQFFETILLAATFTGGFITLNAAFNYMHVSLVMVLRAAEPLTTLALGMLFFGARVSARKGAMLLAVVGGCACSAFGPFQPTTAGLVIVALSNVAFSLRALLGKRLKKLYGPGALEIFAQLCIIGTVLQGGLIAGNALFLGGAGFEPLLDALRDLPSLRLVLINGASFYAYQQLSWLCLGRMSAVSHSLANSMRRPATIAAALLYAPVQLSTLNIAGMTVACAGALLYGLL